MSGTEDDGIPMELRISSTTITVVCMRCHEQLSAGRNAAGTAATNAWAWAHKCKITPSLPATGAMPLIPPVTKEIEP